MLNLKKLFISCYFDNKQQILAVFLYRDKKNNASIFSCQIPRRCRFCWIDILNIAGTCKMCALKKRGGGCKSSSILFYLASFILCKIDPLCEKNEWNSKTFLQMNKIWLASRTVKKKIVAEIDSDSETIWIN